MARAMLLIVIALRMPPQKNPSSPLIIAPITAQIKVEIQKAGQPLFLGGAGVEESCGRVVELGGVILWGVVVRGG